MSDQIERVEAARRFPTNTCHASRHAAQIGEALVRRWRYPMLTEEPAHCGESILATVAALWEARTEIERLTAALQYEQHRAERQGTHSPGCADWGPAHYECAIRERDELRRQFAEARAEREALANVLPGHYYLDPPDGGDVPVLEQLRRMANDAERYRWLRRKFAIVQTARSASAFVPVNLPQPTHIAPDAAVELDAAIDAAMGVGDA